MTPASIDFEYTQRSAPLPAYPLVTISATANISNLALAIEPDDGFAVPTPNLQTTCGTTLSAGTSCAVDVGFARTIRAHRAA